MIAETFFELSSDWHHWAFELLSDLVLGGLGAIAVRPLVRRWIARHDREEHPKVGAMPDAVPGLICSCGSSVSQSGPCARDASPGDYLCVFCRALHTPTVSGHDRENHGG